MNKKVASNQTMFLNISKKPGDPTAVMTPAQVIKELEAQVSEANLKLAEAEKSIKIWEDLSEVYGRNILTVNEKLKVALDELERLAANYGDKYSAQEALDKIQRRG